RWGVTGLLSEMQGTFRKAAAGATAVEITARVRFFYRSSNAGRESFMRLTELEARVFMREDGRVFVRLDRLACAAAQSYLNRCAKALADPAEGASAGEGQDLDWKRNLSAW